METGSLVIGVDFGTDSVRAVVVDAATGEEQASEVAYYRRWAAGMYCDPGKNQFRQHPLDYLEGLEAAVKGAVAGLPPGAAQRVAGIGIDTTGSTPGAVDADGRPLALREEFSENPNAMFILWKDHTAVQEAGEINHAARHWGGTDFTKYEGEVYSSEWFWAKILHILRHDPEVRAAAYSWVEHCDWIPALLTGTENPQLLKRSRCAAGHKAMWHEEWGGLPPEEFLVRIDPLLQGLRDRLYSKTYTADTRAGNLTPAWAERLNLPPGIAVAVGAFDAHMGAVGGGITPGALVKIMGTSTCDIMVAHKETIGDKLIGGICGQVDGSVIPGLIGLEAGQSAYGDVYAWFKDLLSWPLETMLPETSLVDRETWAKLQKEIEGRLLRRLSEEAARINAGETGLLALDWLNGRRTPYADQTLKGAITGLTLGSTAPKIFRALVEATAYGARAINDRFMEEGIAIKEVIALGGIARKNDFAMQVLADVLAMPIKVAASDQTCALGAAMFGAVAAGLYPTLEAAQEKMFCGYAKTYTPDPENAARYGELYRDYLTLGRVLEQHLRKI
ncbi:Ribulokinase [Moorella thermoacetica]|uniref:Ribulokinase n=1 Tax=Neomoorella thermoacetica TaxID=1525 RepID=A0AAC9HHA9_NEOTH|nr:ribulokinase [Moorella thermoacetica]AOQ23643.1 Ribulokinase [Moorella thermoacetica]TYL13827.1 Ribulokinase [Moorella thermoacetica]